MDDSKSTRREFCTAALSLAAIGALLESCGGSPTSPSGGGNFSALPIINATAGNNTVSVAVDASSPLASVGGAALVQSSVGTLLVARTAQDTFSALTSVCTHEVCTITGYQSGTFLCPCHGSEFNTSGRVVRGPAVASLRQFATQFSGDTLTITIA